MSGTCLLHGSYAGLACPTCYTTAGIVPNIPSLAPSLPPSCPGCADRDRTIATLRNDLMEVNEALFARNLERDEARQQAATLRGALERIASVDCQIACASLPKATRCQGCIARDALAAAVPPAPDGAE